MIHIRSDYAGANIKTVSSDHRFVVKLEQDIRDSVNWWFYWNFCARCEEEREIVFEFMNGEVLGPWGPAYSYDGINWAWLGEQSLRNRESFVFQFTADHPEVYFAFSLPYQLQHFESFYHLYKDSPHVRRETLCTSEQKREVPILILGKVDAQQSIFFSSRHHACESTVNYLIEGLLEQLIVNHPSSGILDQICIHYIPFVDIDGVENGDQGKGRAPHDHNRDYTDQPIYEVTRGIIRYVSDLQPVIGIDFHCPYKWGERNDHVFFVKTGTEADRRIERFGQLLKELTSGMQDCGMSYNSVHDIEKGEDWNLPNPTCSSFMINRDVQMAFSMEIPYFGNVDMQVTADSLRSFGGRMAQALEMYIENV